MKLVSLTLVLLLLGCSLAAFEVTLQINPFGWQRQNSTTDYPVSLEVGKPMVPYVPVRILLPFGHKYSGAEISLGESRLSSENATFELAKQQLPTGVPSSALATGKQNSPTLQQLNTMYPSWDWEFLGTQYYRGYQIAMFNLYPYKYNPLTHQLFSCEVANISINSSFEQAVAEYQAAFYTNNSETNSTLSTMINNPEMAQTYGNAVSYRKAVPPARNIDLTYPKQMIIITAAQSIPWFSEYATWRVTMGISNAIYAMEDIVSSYPGADSAEKVRNFIIHAYQTWASSSEPLQYVILGGDDEIVPERGAYGQVGDTMDSMMPVDMYFSNLDGTWNANNNGIWGEIGDNPDLIPEVHIGRFPAQTQDEFNNMFRKIRYYVENTTFSNNLALFLGENLNMNPVTWGGDYKDDVAQYLPSTYNLHTLYQRDGTYSEAAVWNAINSGAGIMNHMGHANEFFLIGQSNGTIESLTNTEYGFLYSQGCYPAAFDTRTSGASESIAEHMVTASGALHSFIGNTRYGWYMPGSVDGASQYYDRQFFRGLFQQNLPQLGKALTYSRLQNLNAALSDDVMRWCYYEVVLFGDPSVAVKAPDPYLPYLNLESYSFSDEEGDNDGTINPGEIIRLYPLITNHAGWAAAQNVTLSIEALPYGVEQLGGCLSIPQILPGGSSPLDSYLRLQLPADLSFGTYNLKLFVESQHPITLLSTGARRFVASFSLTLMDNRFPWETPNAGKSAPLVGDFDPQPGKEILYSDVNGNGYIIGSDGALTDSFIMPVPMNINRSFASMPIGTGDNKLLVFCSRSGDLYGLDQTGSYIFNYHANTAFLFTPMLADINGDGQKEAIAGGLDGKVYAVQLNGTLLNGFPVDTGSAFHSELAAIDFDGDNAWEIVAGTSAGLLYVIGNGGSIKPGFPLQLDSSITGSPTLTNNKRIACATGTKMYIIDSNGIILSYRDIDTHIAGGFALGDLLGDNWGMDIVGVSLSGMLYAVTDEGLDVDGFPVQVGVNFSCPPLLANLDSDPQLEILLHSYVNSVYGYNHDGSQLSGFPFITSYNGSTPATLTDFDGNDQMKLVMGHANGVMMLNLRRNAAGLAPWITYRGSDLRQGSFASTGFVNGQEELLTPVPTALHQNYPNPFNPSTTISYSLNSDAVAQLEIYNLKGQKVRSLINDRQSSGNHSLVWNGRDDAGRAVASGVYLYKLGVDGHTYQQRMLLLK